MKKANEKWRMCVDFTDLNKACPKDSYPLPNIDALVDSASGCKMLSFLDALCTAQVVGSDDVAASDNIGVLNGTPG